MKNRLVYIDLLRIVAAVMVVMIHTSGMLLVHSDPQNIGYWVGLCNGELVRSAVLLFFMITGALMLRKDYDANPKKMTKKTIKVFLLVIVWSFIYAWINVEQFSIKSIVFATIKGPFHFWFFAYLIGLYLVMPLLKVMVEYKEGKLIPYYLTLFFIFGIIIPSLQAIPMGHKWIMDSTHFVYMDMLGFIGYAVLGHYLASTSNAISNKWLFFIFILCCVLQGILTRNVDLLYSSDKFWILTSIEAMCIFAYVRGIVDANVRGGYQQCSSLMMGVYIIHPILLVLIPEMWWNLPCYLVDVLLILGGSLFIAWLLAKIPKVGNWLMTI